MAGSPQPRPADPEFLVVGHITKLHGTRGEVLVWPLTDRPDAVFAEGATLLVGDADGEVGEDSIGVVIERSRPFKKGLLVKLADAERREDVEALVGRYLHTRFGAVAPLDEGEVFYHQLLGLGVETVDGEAVGRVREVYENAAADLLEVETGEGRLLLLPFTSQLVKEVDVAGARIVIDPPAGLLDL